MAKTDKAPVEKTDEEQKKHFITITNDKGEYAPASLADCNRDAYSARMGRKRREKEAMKTVSAAVKAAIQRVS